MKEQVSRELTGNICHAIASITKKTFEKVYENIKTRLLIIAYQTDGHIKRVAN